MPRTSPPKTKKEKNGAYVVGGVEGSAQPNASAQVLAGAQLGMPSQSIPHKFADFVVPLDLQMAANAQEARTLAALRDTLLPKLISGELRMKDTERVIAGVGT